jgi:hypothetical protein
MLYTKALHRNKRLLRINTESECGLLSGSYFIYHIKVLVSNITNLCHVTRNMILHHTALEQAHLIFDHAISILLKWILIKLIRL